MVNPQDPIHLVFERSIRDFRANLKDENLYSEILRTTTIDQVYDITDKLQEEQAKNGHMRHLSRIGPFLERLQGYASSIDTFVQVKPDILALIWGPLKLLLQWTSVLKQSFDELVGTIAEIGDLLPEFEEVIKLFGHNESMKDVLALFFQDMLDVYIIALKFFSLSRWRIMFEAMWPKQREKIRLVMSHIGRHTSLMRKEVQMEHIREEHKARLEAIQHFEKTEKSHRRQEYNAIKAAISPRSYEEDLYRIGSRICENTGRWLLRDATFTKWLKVSEKSTKLIWLQGIPGAGKTYLSSTVVNQALTLERTLFIFLSYKFNSSTSALTILHSFIFQLTSDDDDLQDILCQSTSKELRRDMKRATEILTTLLRVAGPVFIIIDGLDEIDEIERARLLKCLLELSESCDDAKVLVSSRIEDDIKSVLSTKAVEIRVDSHNAGSIQAFINRRVQEWFVGRDFVPEARTEITGLLAPLSSKAKGMFLYAKVVLSSIENLDDMIAIRNELEVLPDTLDDAYSRIMNRIDTLDTPAMRNKARKLIGWVGSSSKPLTIQEIEQALNVRMGDFEGDVRVIARINPVLICGPILEVVDDYVQYVFSPHITSSVDISSATLSLATCCIQYLCQGHHDTDLSENELCDNVLAGKYRLHEYSATMWLDLIEQYIILAKATTPSSDLVNLLRTFMDKRSSDVFTGDNELLATHSPSHRIFESDYPDIHKFLRNVANFQKRCSEGEFDRKQETLWINLDPLTITCTSIHLYDQFDQLLCGSAQHHKDGCDCALVYRHYGQRPFKCSSLGCFFGRHGFPTKYARISHQKHHERPWKCSRSDCTYSQGFLSRKMRDQHWEQCHQEGRGTAQFQQEPDEDELQPLLFDLIRSNKVELFESLFPQLINCTTEVKQSLFEFAMGSGSTAVLNLFLNTQTHLHKSLRFWPGLMAAIKGNNIETFKCLIPTCDNHGYWGTLPEILKSKREAFCLEWEIYIDARYKELRASPHYKQNLLVRYYVRSSLLATALNDPGNEKFILLVWERLNLAKSLTQEYLGAALGKVAQTCRSEKMAKYLIDAGAPVDFRRCNNYWTPLHRAVTKNTPEAAELVKFLLGKGADPEAFATSTSRGGSKIRRIRDEVGAKGISKWLGMSWDELVEKIAKERELLKSSNGGLLKKDDLVT